MQTSRCFAFAQHDKTQRGDASTSLSMTYRATEIATSLKALAMTEYSIGSRNDDAMEFDTPKVHTSVNTTDSNQGVNLN